jgi:hypothetical protein
MTGFYEMYGLGAEGIPLFFFPILDSQTGFGHL